MAAKNPVWDCAKKSERGLAARRIRSISPTPRRAVDSSECGCWGLFLPKILKILSRIHGFYRFEALLVAHKVHYRSTHLADFSDPTVSGGRRVDSSLDLQVQSQVRRGARGVEDLTFNALKQKAFKENPRLQLDKRPLLQALLASFSLKIGCPVRISMC